MSRLISVKPAGDGWSMHAEGLDGEMMFLSGAKAEAAARRLADDLSRHGEEAEIRIFLRGGALAGRVVVPARGLALAS